MTDFRFTAAGSTIDGYRRIAGAWFEHAYEALKRSQHSYAVEQLLLCCRLDPATLLYRQLLRVAVKYMRQSGRRSQFVALRHKVQLKVAKWRGNHKKVLEHGERVLLHQPNDAVTHLSMAEAAEALGLPEVAIWILQQACRGARRRACFLRQLARLYEKLGDIECATALWEAVRKEDGADREAWKKARDLAVNDTIARGGYWEALNGTPAKADPQPELAPEELEESPPGERVAREVALWRERIAMRPADPGGYIRLAKLYRGADLFALAEAALREGLDHTGNAVELELELGDLHIHHLRRRLTRNEKNLMAQPGNHALGQRCQRLRDNISARELKQCRRKADYYPLESGHRCELGVHLFRTGQIDDAIRALQAARADPRHRWRALIFLGLCFKVRKNWPLARRSFEQALHALPPREDEWRKEILFELARGTAEAGHIADAIELGFELANLDYHYRDIHQLLDVWQRQLQERRASQ